MGDSATILIPGEAAIFEALDPKVRRFLRRRLGKRFEEDAVQNTLLTLLLALRSGVVENCEAYAITAAKIAAGDVLFCRRRGMAWSMMQPFGVREHADSRASALSELIQRERQNSLNGLPEILHRFYVLEQPAAQIRKEMRLTETQFRLLKSRAKTKFVVGRNENK